MVGISSAPALRLTHTHTHTLTNPKAAEEVALITESLAVTTRTHLPVPFNPLPLNHKNSNSFPPLPTSKWYNGTRLCRSARLHLYLKRTTYHSASVYKCHLGTKTTYIRCTYKLNKSKNPHQDAEHKLCHIFRFCSH